MRLFFSLIRSRYCIVVLAAILPFCMAVSMLGYSGTHWDDRCPYLVIAVQHDDPKCCPVNSIICYCGFFAPVMKCGYDDQQFVYQTHNPDGSVKCSYLVMSANSGGSCFNGCTDTCPPNFW